jgi:hypothetical protein
MPSTTPRSSAELHALDVLERGELLLSPDYLQRIGVFADHHDAFLGEGFREVRPQHVGGLGELLVGAHQAGQARNAGDRDVAGIEQVVGQLHDITGDRRGDVVRRDLQRAGEVQARLELAIGGFLDLLAQHLGAARGGEQRSRLVVIEIPVDGERRCGERKRRRECGDDPCFHDVPPVSWLLVLSRTAAMTRALPPPPLT